MKFHKSVPVFLGVLFLLGTCVLLLNAGQDPQGKEEFTAWAVNLGGVVKSGTVQIAIDLWSTPEERNELIEAFKQGGQDEMLKVLTKLPKVGFIRIPQSLAYDLHYAYQFPAEDGGRNIVIATNRRITRTEVWNQRRIMEYPFELIQMRLNAKGEGEGTLSWATKISLSKDGQHIELENYGTTPVMLKDIKAKVHEAK